MIRLILALGIVTATVGMLFAVDVFATEGFPAMLMRGGIVGISFCAGAYVWREP